MIPSHRGAVQPPAVFAFRAALRAALAFLLAGVGAAGAPAWAQTLPAPAAVPAVVPVPALRFAEPRADFGEAHQRETIVHRFAVVNEGPKPVALQQVEPRAEGGWGRAEPAVLPPGGRGEVVVYQPTGNRLGVANFRIRVTTDDPASPIYRLGLSGFVQSAYEPEAPRLEFGGVDHAAGKSLDLELTSREVDRLAVEGITGAPEFLEVRVEGRSGDAGEGVRLRAKLAPGAPLGLQAGRLELRTNVPTQPSLTVGWAANVFADVVPSANPVELGLARAGEPFAAEVLLRSRSGAPLAVERVEDPSGRLEVTVHPCPSRAGAGGAAAPGEDPACRLLRLRHVPLAKGTVDGDLRVFVAGRAEPVPLRYTGVAVSADARIKSIELADDLDGGEPWERTGLPPAAAPAQPASPPAVPAGGEPVAPAATLRWQAAREDQVYGYLVLRADERLGPFRRVNPKVVRVPEGTEGAGKNDYVYVDRDVAPGKTYYYYLDVVTTGGLKRRFSGVLAKTVPAR